MLARNLGNFESNLCQALHVQQHRTAVQYSGKRENVRTSFGFKLAVRGGTGAGGLIGSASTGTYLIPCRYSILR